MFADIPDQPFIIPDVIGDPCIDWFTPLARGKFT
jgi:hypothetical protein